MIAKVTAPDGKPCIIHRTYLTPDGQNLRVEGGNARKVMSGSIPKGSAIRLMEHDKVLGIAEGIETAFAASRLFDVPVWAALNAGLLADWEPPEGVEEVAVFGDCDPGFAGQAAAFSLARRLAGKRGIRTSVHIPSTIGQDFNDVFLATLNQETAQ